MNKLVLPDVDGLEFSGTIAALVRNGYVVHYRRVALRKWDVNGKSYNEYERWIYYCPREILHDLIVLVRKYEDSKLDNDIQPQKAEE